MFNIKIIFTSVILIHGLVTITAVQQEQLINTTNNVETSNGIGDLKSSSQKNLESKATWQMDLQKFDLRYSTLPTKCGNYTPPKDCAEATLCTQRSGIYMIENYNSEPYYVECDVNTDDGDWLLIQRRQDGSVDFYRNWIEYEQGFGNIDGEFFIGLKKLYALTNFNGPQELLIIMDDYNLTSAYAKYDNFSIADSNEFYALKELGKYSGTAGDSLRYNVGRNFSTRDRNNSNYARNCAQVYTAAWWYGECSESNLNGKYGEVTQFRGIYWLFFNGSETNLRNVKMMIRRRKY